MMQIEVWAIGRDKSDQFSDAIDLYLKRLRPYLQLRHEHLPPAKTKGIDDRSRYLELEAQTVLKYLKPHDTLILLDEQGKTFDSHEFANDLSHRCDTRTGRLIYLIGGAYGFHEKIYARAQANIRLSDMTMPHRLAKLVLFEQLYRACTILAHQPYHH